MASSVATVSRGAYIGVVFIVSVLRKIPFRKVSSALFTSISFYHLFLWNLLTICAVVFSTTTDINLAGIKLDSPNRSHPLYGLVVATTLFTFILCRLIVIFKPISRRLPKEGLSLVHEIAIGTHGSKLGSLVLLILCALWLQELWHFWFFVETVALVCWETMHNLAAGTGKDYRPFAEDFSLWEEHEYKPAFLPRATINWSYRWMAALEREYGWDKVEWFFSQAPPIVFWAATVVVWEGIMTLNLYLIAQAGDCVRNMTKAPDGSVFDQTVSSPSEAVDVLMDERHEKRGLPIFNGVVVDRSFV